MNDDALARRFIGSVQLVTWHLWRVAESTDIDEGFAAARARGMIDEQSEAFIRECMDMSKQLEAGVEPDVAPTMDMVKEMQLCAIRLNTADSA